MRIYGNLSKAQWISHWLFNKCTEHAPWRLGEEKQRWKKPLLDTSGLYWIHCYSPPKTGDRTSVQRDLLSYRKSELGLERKEDSLVTPKLVVRLQGRDLSWFRKLGTERTKGNFFLDLPSAQIPHYAKGKVLVLSSKYLNPTVNRI